MRNVFRFFPGDETKQSEDFPSPKLTKEKFVGRPHKSTHSSKQPNCPTATTLHTQSTRTRLSHIPPFRPHAASTNFTLFVSPHRAGAVRTYTHQSASTIGAITSHVLGLSRNLRKLVSASFFFVCSIDAGAADVTFTFLDDHHDSNNRLDASNDPLRGRLCQHFLAAVSRRGSLSSQLSFAPPSAPP